MSDVKSKNLYELLGNTSDQDSDREVEVAPNKSVDKTAGRSGKRDAPKAAPAEPVGDSNRGGRGARRGGNDGAFRDRNAGRDYNRSLPTEGEDGGRGARRGGRGPRGPRRGGDRRDRTGQNEHTKQADASWGGPTGDKEWADEQAGEAIAKKEESSGWGTSGPEAFDSSGDATKVPTGSWNAEDEGNPDFKDSAAPAAAGNGFEEEPEPEDNSKSYADYLAEQAEKKLQALGLKEARAPNEGQKENKQWKNAKPLSKDEEGEYVQGKEEKARRERDRKVKEKVDIDFSFKEPERGGRGGGRGGRGRGDGEFRGRGGGRGRGDGEFRGRGGGRGGRGGERGEFRGGRGRGGGPRGGGRGESSGNNGGPAVSLDTDAFPALGEK